MTSNISDLLESSIVDMWSPIPVTPSILTGIENTYVTVDCSNEAAEEILGQSGCEAIQRGIVGYLRLVGVEGDPDKMTDSPVGPGLFAGITHGR
jgi:hypothetical protein